MKKGQSVEPSRIPTKGGYRGGQPAATVPPPSRLPSATIKPTNNRKPALD